MATKRLPTLNDPRQAKPHLAASMYILLVGAFFLLPFILNQTAAQSDLYFPNLTGGFIFFAIGSLWLAFSFHALGAWRWIPYALIAGNLVVLLLALWLNGRGSNDKLVPVLMVDIGCLLVLTGFLAALMRAWHVWLQAMAVALLGVLVAGAVYYAAGDKYLLDAGHAANLPPFLNTNVMVVSLVIGMVVYVVGSIGSGGKSSGA